jgi:dinuclear metal center YbgI/SA1388 family protein
MANLNEITNYLNEYLEIDKFEDDSWNGLQVEGKKEIKKIITGVTAGSELFTKAIKENADLVLVHHGHFWTKANPSITNWNKERLNLLLKNNISLYASHLPLDAHKEVGNNAQLLKLIGADITEEFHKYGNTNISWLGRFNAPKPLKEISDTLNKDLNTTSHIIPFGQKNISTVAVCSGGGGYNTFSEALSLKVDLYISGDTVEIYNNAKDAKMNVVFAGHHATETLGIKMLGKKLSDKFEITEEFIDIPTGL